MDTRGLLSWFLSPSFDYYGISQYDTENVARLICNEACRQNIIPDSTASEECISPAEFNLKAYENNDFLRPVVDLYGVLNSVQPEHIKHFLLHGSLADLKYVKGWSDLDTLVVISDKVFRDHNELLKLRILFLELNRFIVKIDSIAHHGFIVALESDLKNYNNYILPVEVIKTAVNLYGPRQLCIYRSIAKENWIKKLEDARNTFIDFEASGTFRHHPYRGKYLTKEMIKQLDGMYQFKYLIGMVMILPSIYFSALGRPVYKADSFLPFVELFPGSADIIKCVSKIRTDWAEIEQYPYVPNRIPVWVINSLPENYVSLIIELLDEIIIGVKNSCVI